MVNITCPFCSNCFPVSPGKLMADTRDKEKLREWAKTLHKFRTVGRGPDKKPRRRRTAAEMAIGVSAVVESGAA